MDADAERYGDGMSDGAGHNRVPEKQGLYDPQHEHDACGVGFVANIAGDKSHAIVQKAITVLITVEPDERRRIEIDRTGIRGDRPSQGGKPT